MTHIYNSNKARNTLDFEVRRAQSNGRNGQSLVVSIPKSFMNKLGIIRGDLIRFHLDATNERRMILEKIEMGDNVYPPGEVPIGYSM